MQYLIQKLKLVVNVSQEGIGMVVLGSVPRKFLLWVGQQRSLTHPLEKLFWIGEQRPLLWFLLNYSSLVF